MSTVRSQEKNLPNTEFHYENLVSTVMNLFLAGTETTSSTLRYALGVLIKHANVQGKSQILNVISPSKCLSSSLTDCLGLFCLSPAQSKCNGRLIMW